MHPDQSASRLLACPGLDNVVMQVEGFIYFVWEQACECQKRRAKLKFKPTRPLSTV